LTAAGSAAEGATAGGSPLDVVEAAAEESCWTAEAAFLSNVKVLNGAIKKRKQKLQ